VALDALPVKFPTKLVAVTIPETLIPDELTLRIDDPEDTKVISVDEGKNNPVVG
jgi:hypothetical protein